jgi:hypothetical protein
MGKWARWIWKTSVFWNRKLCWTFRKCKDNSRKIRSASCFETLVVNCQLTSCHRSVALPSSTNLFTAGVEVVYFHLITLRHIPQSVGLLWTRDRPVAETSTWQHKHCTTDRHPRPRVGFEPTIPASARPQTHALDRAATGIGLMKINGVY